MSFLSNATTVYAKSARFNFNSKKNRNKKTDSDLWRVPDTLWFLTVTLPLSGWQVLSRSASAEHESYELDDDESVALLRILDSRAYAHT
jgi:hypothetical protein